MTDREEREEHIKRLEAALACEEKRSSGKCAKDECDDNCALLYERGNWGEWKETLRYAINSLKTDLKYDLLYEETIEQKKPTTETCETCRYYGSHHGVCDYCYKCSLWTEKEPSGSENPTGSTTKDYLGVDCISRTDAIHAVSEALERTFVEHEDIANKLIGKLPSVTQLSSGLDKNSKKLEKDFGESDCISREQALRELKESAEHHANDSREEVLLRRDRDIIRALPSVTLQEPKTGYCKNCKFFELNSWAACGGIPIIVAHEICKAWGEGCKTKVDGYCFLFEPKESEDKE